MMGKKCLQGYDERGNLIYCWWDWKLLQALGKPMWTALKKLNIDILDYLDTLLLGICPKVSTYYPTYTCSAMIIIAVFTRIGKWKQSKYSSTVNSFGIFIEISLNLLHWINFTLILIIIECGKSFYLLLSSFSYFFSFLKFSLGKYLLFY